jgi:hypothetical protein
MRVSIQNFRGLADLNAEVAPLLLLAGNNAAGKSSGCVAIGAVASGSMLPFDGMTKKAAQLLVRDGQERAGAVIETEDGTASVAWPACERATEGRFRDASTVAVGLEDLTAMKPAERAGRLIALIGAEPTKKDLSDALTAAEIPAEFIEEIWKKTAGGWDAAHAFYKEEGAKLKGQWEKLTGGRFGVSKALTWRPDGWVLSLEGASVEGLRASIAEAEVALDKAKRKSGADEATLKRLQETAAKLSQHQETLKSLDADLEQLQLILIRASAELNKLGPKPRAGAAPLVCPCCQAPVRLVDGALAKPAADDDPEALAIAMAAYEAAENAFKKAERERNDALGFVATAKKIVDEAKAAQQKLADLPTGDAGAEDAIATARTALTGHQNALAMKERVIESMGLVERIQRRIKVVAALDKDGVRQTVLADRLGDFNGRLLENSKTADWDAVFIDQDMLITYGGRLLSLCSESEKFRVRAILQLTIAAKEQALLVVIDGADILDRDGRNGLFGLLGALEIPAVIGMTISKREDMPDLARAGLGNSVWIEDGRGAGAAVRQAA